jgi:hypothetical protein
MIPSRRLIVIPMLVLALVAVGCSDDGDSETTEETDPTTTVAAEPEPEPTDTTDAAETGGTDLPDTPVVATLGDPYDFNGGTPDPAVLPAEPGTVEARWYRTTDVYAIVYAGLDADVDAYPGNSVLTDTGFEFVSNAPLPDASCDNFPTLIDNTADQGVQICDGQVSYLTLIPADTPGTVFASLEAPAPDVGGVGISASTEVADPSSAPEIDAAVLTC